MKEVEILGHTINDSGSHFSRDKLEAVFDITLPTTGSFMHSFLGLTNYYRKHVKGIAGLDQPLRQLVTKYPGTRKIPWAQYPTEKQAFYALRKAVAQCPRLFFYDSRMPVHVHTDACNNGIGGYVFQMDSEGNEYPIGFLSKRLHGAELNWSTFEQECFAIHQTLKKFEYLLRDVEFQLRTDHRNLLYLNQFASSKVLRWKWDVQQFNFKVKHIPGELNVAADVFSRLCLVHDTAGTLQALDHLQPKLVKDQPGAFLLAINSSQRMDTTNSSWMRGNRPTEAEVYHLISQVHGWGNRDETSGNVKPGQYGHGGVERTLQLLRDFVAPSKWWPHMRAVVRKFIYSCPQCQFMTPVRSDVHERRSVHPYNVSVGKPMDRVNIDSIGPFPEDEEGNKYIMVFIDVFSRFVELVPIPDLSALVAAKELIKFIGRYGCPREILTDNGTQYANELAYQIYDTAMINHLKVMPYSHEENSIVERANREVNTHLRAIVFDRKIKVNWSIALPLIQRLMNTFEHSSIGCAPITDHIWQRHRS